MRKQWLKELNAIRRQIKQIYRLDTRDAIASQRRLKAERTSFDRLTKGRIRLVSQLRKRIAILEGRLAS